MELTSDEVGLRGSWYAVTVAEVEAGAGAGAGEVLVRYEAEGYGEEKVARHRLRPPPPPLSAAPPSWSSRLRHGEPLQLSFEHGWWEVKFLRRAGSEFTVVAAEYNISHTVGKARLRPCWEHTPGAVPSREWSSVVAGRTFYYDAASGAAVAE